MKILLSSESYWPNKDGGAIFERNLVHGLIKAGHDVRVLVPGKSWRHYDEKDCQSYIYRTASVRLPLNKAYKVTYYARPQVIKALNDFQPDIVHIHTMAITGASLLKHSKRRGITVVATNHLMPENVLMSFPKFVLNSKLITKVFWKTLVAFHNKFTLVSTPTESAAKLLKDEGLRPPIKAISNGINVDIFYPLKNKGQPNSRTLARFNLPDRYFIYLGRVNAEKRIDFLIRSFAVAKAVAPNLHLVIAGKGNRLEELKRLAKDLGIDDRVHLLGLVSKEEKILLYQHAEFFAITSPAELQSIVVLEAAACGLPILAVDMVALRELCHDGHNGYLVSLDNQEDCAKAIVKLHSSPQLRKKFGTYSRKLVVDNHSNDSTLEQYQQFYEEAITIKQNR